MNSVSCYVGYADGTEDTVQRKGKKRPVRAGAGGGGRGGKRPSRGEGVGVKHRSHSRGSGDEIEGPDPSLEMLGPELGSSVSSGPLPSTSRPKPKVRLSSAAAVTDVAANGISPLQSAADAWEIYKLHHPSEADKSQATPDMKGAIDLDGDEDEGEGEDEGGLSSLLHSEETAGSDQDFAQGVLGHPLVVKAKELHAQVLLL